MSGKITQRNNFIYTALALIALLISASLVNVMPEGILEYIVEGFTLLTFGVCILSLRFDKAWTRFMVSLIICWLAATLIYRLFAIEMLDYLTLVLMMAFFWGTFRSIARQILFVGHVDANKIIGSIVLFLLIGLIWSIIYILIFVVSPQAFNGIEGGPWRQNLSELTYFSFVTLTTLGYGDISPRTPFAQVMVYMEAIVGVFYMAVVVASLVSTGLSQTKNSRE
ncbi:potassium channel family protein [Shewanella psychrotolerans]|uniref:potassium channel family protein n=1 Tax=Shewanella psychrotolerans TaxID=2864206 RepID=UPI001C660058|nr:potassium channel family protein [Shewanella psychrotolerans]QYK02036.1 two pore domain potassium channel family protein [Shewanella psychrotolerans]